MTSETWNLIIAGLGSIGTAGSFAFLFFRDKNKQKQIDKLAGIASMLEAQNEIMQKQNDLIGQQVDIFRNTSLLKGNDGEAMSKLAEIETKKLRLSVMPILRTSGGSFAGSTGQFSIDVINNGDTATILKVENNSSDVLIYHFPENYEMEKGKSIRIIGSQKGDKHIKDCDIDIDIIYEDKLKNKYGTKIKGIGNHVKVVETNELMLQQ